MILASKKWNVHTDKYPNFERGSKGCAIQILHTWSKCFAIDQNYEQHVFPEAIKTEHHVVNWWIKRTKCFYMLSRVNLSDFTPLCKWSKRSQSRKNCMKLCPKYFDASVIMAGGNKVVTHPPLPKLGCLHHSLHIGPKRFSLAIV